ncbi:globin-like protein [Pseudovirgaria hyperparasitica]|uniref:nitric oxide dioxygenase n=1 Tax=Pseudovirgaria hyperparasitica TaxID=470096 RepID=A0A6A6VXC5_9PEZI|nr:globin-like protein [Pseudovirgaria hyperparasitica]KAF2754825.1 globin-like protein [Pseudovirgaria hyperparasitica]
MSLTTPQRAIIKATIPALALHGTAITSSFYESLLSAHPDLSNIFNATHQSTSHQARALASALHAYATHIDDQASLKKMLELVCAKHVSLGITPPMYTLVGEGLIAAMQRVLGDLPGGVWSAEVRAAWTAAYWELANSMIALERAGYARVEHSNWVGWQTCRIVRKEMETECVTSFYLVRGDGADVPGFVPGMYVSLRVRVPGATGSGDEGMLQARQYSLSDGPGRGYLRVSVKREDGRGGFRGGYVSGVLHGMGVGGEVEVSCPGGDFGFDAAKEGSVDGDGDGNVPLVLLGAGVGITPLMAMLEAEKGKRRITLVHTARRDVDRVFRVRLRDVEREYVGLRVVFFTTCPDEGETQGEEYDCQGRMDMDILRERELLHLGDERTRYFVCGPTEFMCAAEAKLKEYGVDSERVRTEMFGVGGGQ